MQENKRDARFKSRLAQFYVNTKTANDNIT